MRSCNGPTGAAISCPGTRSARRRRRRVRICRRLRVDLVLDANRLGWSATCRRVGAPKFLAQLGRASNPCAAAEAAILAWVRAVQTGADRGGRGAT